MCSAKYPCAAISAPSLPYALSVVSKGRLRHPLDHAASQRRLISSLDEHKDGLSASSVQHYKAICLPRFSRASAFSQTLSSPLRMSPTPYDGSPPYQSQTFPTPPSTAGFSSHMPMQDMNNSSATLEQNTMDQSQGDTPMTDAPDYRRSDHDRQPSPRPKSPSVAMPLLCQKRKIPVPSRCIA